MADLRIVGREEPTFTISPTPDVLRVLSDLLLKFAAETKEDSAQKQKAG